MAAGLGITIYPESLTGHLGGTVAVGTIIHPSFRSRTILVWRRSNRSELVQRLVTLARGGVAAQARGPAPRH